MAQVIQFFKENETFPFLDDLAALRIQVFREYPYLYDGDTMYEKKYLKKFIDTPDSLIAVVFDGGKVIGAITGLPMQYEAASIKDSWSTSTNELNRSYYFSEILFLPAYRGKHLGTELLHQAEVWVSQLNKYTTYILATVIRPATHLLKPVNYEVSDFLWKKFGYKPLKNKTCTISWKELGEVSETDKPMLFWSKEVIVKNGKMVLEF